MNPPFIIRFQPAHLSVLMSRPVSQLVAINSLDVVLLRYSMMMNRIWFGCKYIPAEHERINLFPYLVKQVELPLSFSYSTGSVWSIIIPKPPISISKSVVAYSSSEEFVLASKNCLDRTFFYQRCKFRRLG